MCLIILFSYSKLLIFKGYFVEQVGDPVIFGSFSMMDEILGDALGSYIMFATLPTEILKGG